MGTGTSPAAVSHQARIAHAAGVMLAALLALASTAALDLRAPEEHSPALRPAASVSFTLYGSLSGWGETAATIGSPGPTITVDQDDQVTMSLFSADGRPHTFLVDYDGDDAADPGEPRIAFTSSTTLTFTAGVAGTFTYWCDLHYGRMWGLFVVNAVGAPPSAALSMPDGGQVWSGGSSHAIWWNLSDPDHGNAELILFLNYTSSAGSGAIAGPVAGTGNPNSFLWAVPAIDAGDVVVNLTVVDPTGRKGLDEAAVPTIDSTRPQVETTVPEPAATDVPVTTNVIVTWSESMNTSATGSAFGLQDVAASTWVPGAGTWDVVRRTFTFDPAADLTSSTVYRAFVNASARDDSDPGNAPAAPVTWDFTTGAVADTEPPRITSVVATPDPQEVGGSVNVSATVTDNVGVVGAWLRVTWSAGSRNDTMAPGPAGTYHFTRTYTEPGVHGFSIWAGDASGLWSSASGQFTVADSEAPTIMHTPPAAIPLGESLNLTATVSDASGVADVRLNWTDPSGRAFNVSMASSGSSFWHEAPLQLREGNASYHVWAVDAVARGARTPTHSVPVLRPTGAILLYGDVRGWGLDPESLESPGPTIRVAVGAAVHLVLLAAEPLASPAPRPYGAALPHNLFVDYDGDGAPDEDEPRADDFHGNASHLQFTADRPGRFTYYCAYHPGTMFGTLFVEGAGPAPAYPSLLWIGGGAFGGLLAAVAAFLLLRRRRGGAP